MTEKHSSKRRTVLKTIPAAASGLAGITTAGARQPVEFHGYTYEPGEQEILGRASGTFNRTENELAGRLDLGSETYGFNSVRADRVRAPEGVPVSSFETRIRSGTVRKNGDTRPLDKRVHVVSVSDGGITGFVKPPGGDRTAFSLVEASGSTASIREMLRATAASGGEE
jgi:hypothetical protein